jgi:hypothetical protein
MGQIEPDVSLLAIAQGIGSTDHSIAQVLLQFQQAPQLKMDKNLSIPALHVQFGAHPQITSQVSKNATPAHHF